MLILVSCSADGNASFQQVVCQQSYPGCPEASHLNRFICSCSCLPALQVRTTLVCILCDLATHQTQQVRFRLSRLPGARSRATHGPALCAPPKPCRPLLLSQHCLRLTVCPVHPQRYQRPYSYLNTIKSESLSHLSPKPCGACSTLAAHTHSSPVNCALLPTRPALPAQSFALSFALL